MVRVVGMNRLVPACATRVEDGMVVESDTDEVHSARKTALELLLGDHTGDCIAPCQSACPAHLDIPAMLSYMAKGDMTGAIRVIKERIALPAVLGRICPEICEKACRRGSRDAAISICRLKRFVADWDLASERPYISEKKPDTGKRVAVIGAGPAGLSAAYYLLRDGHSCVVLDGHPLPGGALRYEVPEDRLPRKVLDAEIHTIEELGAEFRLGVRVGNVSDIRSDFDAVLITGHDNPEFGSDDSGIFVAGSAASSSKLAVRAVADGRAAAHAISECLAGKVISRHEKLFTVRIGKMETAELEVMSRNAQNYARMRIDGDDLALDDAQREAMRCLHCECGKFEDCKLRNLAIEYGADPVEFRGERRKFQRESSHPDIIYEPGKCISCGICVRIAETEREPLGLTFIGRGFTVSTGVPFSEPMVNGLKTAALRCADACPTGALVRKSKQK